jgi:cobalamin-dependent methionine synthase I
MKAIANNLGFWNREFTGAVRAGDSRKVSAMAKSLRDAGADIINISLSLDGDGDERHMAFAVDAVREAGLPVSVDSRNPAAHDAAVTAASRPATQVPIIHNYFSGQPSKNMDAILKIAAGSRSDIVVYANMDGTPADADERLRIISDLIERANAAGIPNEKIIVDPVILHVAGGSGNGQEQAVAVQETISALGELVEPPIRTTCWVHNVSAGAPSGLRFAINDTYLAMLAGLGLWSAYINVLNKETMRTVRLIRALKNEAVYSTSDAEL